MSSEKGESPLKDFKVELSIEDALEIVKFVESPAFKVLIKINKQRMEMLAKNLLQSISPNAMPGQNEQIAVYYKGMAAEASLQISQLRNIKKVAQKQAEADIDEDELTDDTAD